jgi:hypothetical protein
VADTYVFDDVCSAHVTATLLFDGATLMAGGSSAPAASFAVSGDPLTLLAARSPGDLDGDGFADLVAAVGLVSDDDRVSYQMTVLDGPLSGASTEADADLTLPAPSAWIDLPFPGQDLDGDGTTDLVYTNFVGEVRILYGPLTAGQDPDAPDASFSGEGGEGVGAFVPVGDLDGNGAVDVVIAVPDAGDYGAVYVLDGPFAGSVRPSEAAVLALSGTSWPGYAWTDAAAGDLDGDGATDLVLSSPLAPVSGADLGRVWIIPALAAATGLLDDTSPLYGPSEGWFGEDVRVADLDGDGASDLLVAMNTVVYEHAYDSGQDYRGSLAAWLQ